jgi:hypothetical protein
MATDASWREQWASGGPRDRSPRACRLPTGGRHRQYRCPLESLAPAGGVLIGPETYERLPDGAIVEERPGLRIKGKEGAFRAYVLLALP